MWHIPSSPSQASEGSGADSSSLQKSLHLPAVKTKARTKQSYSSYQKSTSCQTRPDPYPSHWRHAEYLLPSASSSAASGILSPPPTPELKRGELRHGRPFRSDRAHGGQRAFFGGKSPAALITLRVLEALILSEHVGREALSGIFTLDDRFQLILLYQQASLTASQPSQRSHDRPAHDEPQGRCLCHDHGIHQLACLAIRPGLASVAVE